MDLSTAAVCLGALALFAILVFRTRRIARDGDWHRDKRRMKRFVNGQWQWRLMTDEELLERGNEMAW